MVADTLRTTAVGMTGHLVSRWEYLPEMVSVAVGVTTMVYLVFQIILTISQLRSKQYGKKKRKKSNRNPR